MRCNSLFRTTLRYLCCVRMTLPFWTGSTTPDSLRCRNVLRSIVYATTSAYTAKETYLVLCDGMSIPQSMLTRAVGSSTRTFPIQRPTPADFSLWNQAIHAISHQRMKLLTVLGKLLRRPHAKHQFYTNEARNTFYRDNDDGSYNVFSCLNSRQQTRFGTNYYRQYTIRGECPRSIAASVVKQNASVMSLNNVLSSWSNKSLWQSWVCEGTGDC